MNVLTLERVTSPLRLSINLPSSKSISNRALIIRYLSEGKIALNNLSEARDTQLLLSLLESTYEELDVYDAGTTMRFLCAFCCAINRKTILTGTERMQGRPIGPLVNALQQLGFQLGYLKQLGFPPVSITPLSNFDKLKSSVEVSGSISSQFISALLLIAPTLPNGLKIKLIPPIHSRQYIDITLSLLKQLGIKYVEKDNCITIQRQSFLPGVIHVESDWTNAFYWYSLCALLPGSSFVLCGLNENSIQGDKQVAEWMKLFGVHTSFTKEGAVIAASAFEIPFSVSFHFNFIHHPDVAQTLIVLCAAKNITATFTGIESLRIKETDRIAALQFELSKCGVSLVETADGIFKLEGNFKVPSVSIKTYDDHRMAMAFAPLCALGAITIENPEVVHKSYPDFWKEIAKLQLA